jgi:hypothetical protein
METQLLRLEA